MKQAASNQAVKDATVDDVVHALLDSGAMPESSLKRARRAARDSGERLDVVLRKLGLVSGERMIFSVPKSWGSPWFPFYEPGRTRDYRGHGIKRFIQ